MKTINNRKKLKKYQIMNLDEFDMVKMKLKGFNKTSFKMFEYVRRNIENIDVNNKIEVYMCDEYMKHLLAKEKLSRSEKIWMIKYLSLELARDNETDFEVRNIDTVTIFNRGFVINDLRFVSKFLSNALGYQTEKVNKQETDYDYQLSINIGKIDKNIGEKEDYDPVIELLVTLYHEFTHMRQKQDAFLDDPTFFNSLTTKEYLVSSQNFYVENYSDLLFELEADMTGTKIMLEKYEKYNKEKYDQIKDEKENEYNLMDAKLYIYTLRDSEEYDLGELITSKHADKLIAEKPSIMGAYQVLKYEYEKNGTPKTIETLVKEEAKHIEIYKDKYKQNKDLLKETKLFYNNVFWIRLIKSEIDYEKLYNAIGSKGFKRIEKALSWKMSDLSARDKVNNSLGAYTEGLGYELLKNGMVIDKNKIKTNELLKNFRDYRVNQEKEIDDPKIKKM